MQSLPVRRSRILVVEDDIDIRRIFMTVLRREGHRVDEAADGEDGWNVLRAAGRGADSYDLLITDNDMPKLTGMELIGKAHSAGMTLPIIMVSGTMPMEVQALGLAGVLWKPFLPVQLSAAVRDALEESRTARRLLADLAADG
jgi:DNA-binding response OmpR family regulator